MNHLKDFASYLLGQKLEEITALKLKNLRALGAPLLDHFTHLPEEEILSRLKQTMFELLKAIESGTEYEKLDTKLDTWERDQLPGIERTAVSLTDIVLINAAEKDAIIACVPAYAKKVDVAIAIIRELEKYYTHAQTIAASTMQRIQASEAARRQDSEERFRDIFENATDLIHIVDPVGAILYINKAWQEALGYTEEELTGTSILDYVVEKERERFRAYRERVIAGLPALEGLTTCFMTKDGREITVEGYLSCKYKDGKPLYTRSILRDVTQRKVAEQQIQFYTVQLIEREENIRQLIRNAPDAIIVIDTESRIKLWNPTAEAMFGWLAMDVVGRDLTQTIIPPAYREAHLKGMKRYLETGEERVMHRTIEITAVNNKGEEFYVSLTISSTTQGGEPVFIAFIRDITKIKMNALELDKKREQLERSNQELEQFAWLASHDLKEPLRKIHTFSDMLLRHKDEMPANLLSYLEKIQYSARRMSNLIEDLLSYSNANGDSEKFVLTDLNTILQDVLIDLEVAIKLKRAVINYDKLPVVEVLPFQIRQLFQNLISNALKYSKTDVPPVIQIDTRQVGDMTVIITIKDNGIGFNKLYSEKAFQIFQRLVSKTEYEGTGIGLALCKKIVENHNGSIAAESEEGVGSEFSIVLPILHQTHQLTAQAQI